MDKKETNRIHMNALQFCSEAKCLVQTWKLYFIINAGPQRCTLEYTLEKKGMDITVQFWVIWFNDDIFHFCLLKSLVKFRVANI